MKSCFFLIAILLTLDLSVQARPPAGKEHEGTLVDSGSFGIFMSSHRVGTETFSIYQNNNGSVIESEFKTDGAPQPASQSSEMRLTPNGDIRRYDWKELSPGKAQLSVLVNDQFLTQKWSMSPQEKEQEQPYLLTPSTSILDDYFFVHREVLVWKFLASTCKQENGHVQCPIRQRTNFPTMNPHQHSSSPGTMEYLGREKIMLKGVERECNKLELKSDAGTWLLWLDDQFMVQRISIPAESTEVIRD